MTTYSGPVVMGLFYSGGADNAKPSDSLGGLLSTHRVVGMYPQIITPVPGLVIEDATPECQEGVASVSVSGGAATFTPPDGAAGTPEPLSEGAREFLTGSDGTKRVLVYRAPGLEFDGTATFRLVDQMNGVVAMSDVVDADRQAGETYYRAVFLKRLGEVGKSWLWITTDGQSSFALAKEEPESDGSIQTISDENTPPAGLSWVNAVSEGTALEIEALGDGESMGVWIRRTFPAAGDVAVDEQVNFHLKVEEGG